MSETQDYPTEKRPILTKYCLDPWSFLLVKANGSVQPCCWRPPIGSVEPGDSLTDLVRSDQMNKLRMALLIGDLDDYCQNCSARRDIEPKSLQFFVSEYVSDESEVYKVSQGVLIDKASGEPIQNG